jgi:hypothetical protein
MFKTLIVKEIQESIMNFRFWMVAVLCLLLIPFGLYIASKDYNGRYAEYLREENMNIEKSKGNLPFDFKAQGTFPPSPLSILSNGLKDYLPYTVQTSFDNYAKT